MPMIVRLFRSIPIRMFENYNSVKPFPDGRKTMEVNPTNHRGWINFDRAAVFVGEEDEISAISLIVQPG